MILQLNPMIPITRKSDGMKGYAFLVIDYSQEHYTLFVCAMDDGDVWLLDNRQISMQNNPSLGRLINNKTKDNGKG
jgi:hypothetical protein